MIYVLIMIFYLERFTANFALYSNDSIVSKSVEGLTSVFEIFILHDGH